MVSIDSHEPFWYNTIMASIYRIIRHCPNTVAIHEARCNDDGDIIRIAKPIAVGSSIPDLLQTLVNMQKAFDFPTISSEGMDEINRRYFDMVDEYFAMRDENPNIKNPMRA